MQEKLADLVIFQSTLPARGATRLVLSAKAPRRHFNPRSPHGERPPAASRRTASARFQSTLPARGATCCRFCTPSIPRISIHAPRTGSDSTSLICQIPSPDFNPRSPHGERPNAVAVFMRFPPHFNPRSPHGERRRGSFAACAFHSNFNPRSPHGERRVVPASSAVSTTFQSTLPARGAT